MRIERYPYRARAWAGQTLLAESERCVALERKGQPSVLYFPRDDIAWSLLRAAGPDDARDGTGTSELWTAGGQPHPVVRVLTEPALGLDALRAHGTFDLEAVCVEVVDAVPGTAPRDVTLKRFPTWGDAAHLLALIDVQPDGDGRYAGGVHSDGRRPVVEASQILGQAIVAGSRRAPGRRTVSRRTCVVRPADARRPLGFELEELSAGRTFTGLAVRVTPGRPLLCRRHAAPRCRRPDPDRAPQGPACSAGAL